MRYLGRWRPVAGSNLAVSFQVDISRINEWVFCDINRRKAYIANTVPEMICFVIIIIIREW
jgi:hypothetical protein